jgi:hypothetical protein
MHVRLRDLVEPKSPTQQMLNPFNLAEFDGDITTWGMVIRQDATETPDSVPSFKPFDNVQTRWTESLDVFRQVGHNVELHFVNYAVWIDLRPNIEHISDKNLEIGLNSERLTMNTMD